MLKNRRLIATIKLLILIGIVSSQAVLADEEGVKTYTIDESIKIALENNWSVKGKEEKVLESEYAEQEAKSGFYPEFSTSYSYTGLNKAPASGGIVVG
ncbi:MAG: TolC family protein, partial [Deltaproteobacteria bacterium]|nr:TolC family protein [Deltaproteobacteria bacterium]